MSLFWNIWVTILSIGCWAWILYWLASTQRFRPELDEEGTTGHVYDGISERDGPLPKWWLVIFWGTLAWALVYMLLYPSILPSHWKGLATVKVDGQEVPWTSANELASDLERNNALFINTFNEKILQDPQTTQVLQKIDQLQAEQMKKQGDDADLKAEIDKNIELLAPAVLKLSQNPQAVKIGQRLFLQNCSVCHGSQARGAPGFPNLTDNDWLYGGKPENILMTLNHGRVGGMPAWKSQIGEDGVRAASEYVLSLSSEHGGAQNGKLDPTLVAQGKAIFSANCAVCHGENAKGNHDVGAPNLTDNIWLYGGDRETVRETLRGGRAGVMPHWDTKLGEERIMLLAAYVYQLSDHGKDVPDSKEMAASANADSASGTASTPMNIAASSNTATATASTNSAASNANAS